MKKIFLSLFVLLALASCQNELYKDASKDFQSAQGVYITNKGGISVFVEENDNTELNDLTISLAQKIEKEVSVNLEVGNAEQLAAYNHKNGTNYVLLPKEMYEVPTQITFQPKYTLTPVSVKLKNVQFSSEGVYALPIKIKNGEITPIGGQDEALIVFEQKIVTKALRIAGSGTESIMFPNDFSVNQWTMEVMINRSSYAANNRAVCGTKVAPGSSTLDEIFVRFGDVTIRPDQLQIKTGSSQIDVPADKFTAKPNTWYMLSFVYDGKMTRVYVNGLLVAEREIRTGAYGLTGVWISGINELVREFRFWKVARTSQQILSSTWKMVNPDDDNLLLYYPFNGKKNDREAGLIIEDETMGWDWSKTQKDLPVPSRAKFDNNDDKGFVFPPESN